MQKGSFLIVFGVCILVSGVLILKILGNDFFAWPLMAAGFFLGVFGGISISLSKKPICNQELKSNK